MERDAGESRRIAVGGRAEIDTRAPFRSVREAVALFGEKVLAGEIYANKFQEVRTDVAIASPSPRSRIQALATDLEQTKQTLAKTLEQNSVLSHRIKALTQELEQARKEIQLLKADKKSRVDNPDIEEIKFVEQHQVVTSTGEYNKAIDREDHEIVEEFEKRRLVKFASPPRLTRVMSSVEEAKDNKKNDLERPPSVKKTKKKGFVPFMVRFFSKKKEDSEEDSQSPEHVQ
ncbi:PREDICTED: WEB family protein At2g17940 [Tarenaya hassleriana]|uniref:WEB family protein At2g17940 n=1 Tax=Tarenaya hassleriana TaxID=28532 RepID=UPI00053C18B7|nr:PREDICTED: WEB family protein At2g17940 [Tarenaya hassleriana]